MLKKHPFLKKIAQGMFLAGIGTGVALVFWAFGLINTWEASSWDWRVAGLARPGKASDRVITIFVDQNSLDWAGNTMGLTWPWPREVYAHVVNFCRRNQARAIGFDVLFDDPSPYGVEDDLALGRALKRFAADSGGTAGVVALSRESGKQSQWNRNIPDPAIRVPGLLPYLENHQHKEVVFRRATLPVDEIASHFTVLCNVNLEADPDRVYRRLNFFSVFDNRIFPSLGMGLYLASHPDARLKMDGSSIEVNGYTVRLDQQGRAILRYRGPSGTHTAFSAAHVLNSEARVLSGGAPDPENLKAFKDKFVLFGFSAPGLYDLHPSPIDKHYPGVEVHATLLDNLISRDFIQPTPGFVNAGITLVLTLFCGIILSFYSKPFQGVMIGLTFMIFPLVLSSACYIQGFRLDFALPESSLILTIAGALVFNYAVEGRQKRFIKSAFKQYLSPDVIEQIIQDPQKLKLGGERRTLSIFFSDIQGFTSISETLDPQTLTVFINDFLTAMTDIIHEEGGTIDKYEGDAIIAFWNAPLEVKDHAVRSVRAALRCQAKLARIRPALKKMTKKDVHMRVGINTGPAVVGNMGSNTRFDYTMLGDSVNLAARLEGANKQFGTYTMISGMTRQCLDHRFNFRELGRIAVKGRKEPIRIFEPMLPDQYNEAKSLFETFDNGLQCFYRGEFKQAARILEPVRDRDPAADAYVRMCKMLSDNPPENWEGVWVMTSK